jgi:hypothetical protein
VAVNCCEPPWEIVTGFGVTAIELSTIPVPESVTVCVDPATFPELSVTVIPALLCVPEVSGRNPISSRQLAPFASVAGDIGHGCTASAV